MGKEYSLSFLTYHRKSKIILFLEYVSKNLIWLWLYLLAVVFHRSCGFYTMKNKVKTSKKYNTQMNSKETPPSISECVVPGAHPTHSCLAQLPQLSERAEKTQLVQGTILR